MIRHCGSFTVQGTCSPKPLYAVARRHRRGDDLCRNKSPRVIINYPFSRFQNFVPSTCPTNSNRFSELRRQVAGTCLLKICLSHRVYCSRDRSLGPNKEINQSNTKSDCPGTCPRNSELLRVPATSLLV